MIPKIQAGVDESGRGSLAGSVVAAAVILDIHSPIKGIMDSKKLSAFKREYLFNKICEKSLAFGICEASAKEIDALNILQATFLAMKRALERLTILPTEILIDGNQAPLNLPYKTIRTIIKGDSKIESISAASILAKVTRDRQLMLLDGQYPDYGFAKNKGYPTRLHLQALKMNGIISEHRLSYKPVKKILKLS